VNFHRVGRAPIRAQDVPWARESALPGKGRKRLGW
jgi:hypothetical protein